MVKNLRPRQAAEALGIGLSTFWLKAKTDADFPPLIRLGPKATVVREADLEAYVQKKADGGATAPPPALQKRLRAAR
jgi:predicted DNA-binding transcriptional regulator AlpA